MHKVPAVYHHLISLPVIPLPPLCVSVFRRTKTWPGCRTSRSWRWCWRSPRACRSSLGGRAAWPTGPATTWRPPASPTNASWPPGGTLLVTWCQSLLRFICKISLWYVIASLLAGPEGPGVLIGLYHDMTCFLIGLYHDPKVSRLLVSPLVI